MIVRRELVSALLGLGLVAAMAGAARAAAAPPSAARGLIAEGAAPDLYLLYTGDVIGYLDPCG